MAFASIIDDIRSFQTSRALLTAVELDVFTRLGREPMTAPGLAALLEADERGLTRLLDALVAGGALLKEAGRYRPAERTASLSADHPQSVLPMAQHLVTLWDTWSDLTQTVRTGRNPEAERSNRTEKSLAAFIGAMHVVGRELAEEVAAAYDASWATRLLDIGGGSGTYSLAFLRRNPRLRGVLFDQAGVVPLARQRLDQEGFLQRVELVASDFYRADLLPGCDLALLSGIIHQNSPAQNEALFGKVRQPLQPGGRLLIRDHVMDEDRSRPAAGAWFALNMLVNTPGGDCYTFAEIKAGLERAGFRDVAFLRRGERMDGLVEART